MPGHRPINREGVGKLAETIISEGLNSMSHPVIILLLDEAADSHFDRTTVPIWKRIESDAASGDDAAARHRAEAGAPVDDETEVCLSAASSP